MNIELSINKKNIQIQIHEYNEKRGSKYSYNQHNRNNKVILREHLLDRVIQKSFYALLKFRRRYYTRRAEYTQVGYIKRRTQNYFWMRHNTSITRTAHEKTKGGPNWTKKVHLHRTLSDMTDFE